MKSKQIMFFATFSDIEPILRNFESLNGIQYFEAGLFDNRDIIRYGSIFDVADLGIMTHGDWNHDRNLLITPNDLSLNVRSIPQRNGGLKFAVDQMMNPNSICLQIGGIYKEKGNVLVAGKVATISDESFSLEIYKNISSAIKREFNRIKDFYVGDEAVGKMHSGWRLVLDEKRRKEFDLKID